MVEEKDNLIEAVQTEKIDAIDKLIEDIYNQRKEGLAVDGEYSEGNLLFKEFRNRGYLDKLKELKNELIGKELSLAEDTEKVKDHKWVNRGKEGTHGEFRTKKEADAQRKAMFANGFSEELEERLDERQRIDYKDELSRIAFNQAIIFDSGLFKIYNVKENDVNRVITQIRNLDYIEWVNKNVGRYDFGKVAMFGQPQARYYEITGQIKN